MVRVWVEAEPEPNQEFGTLSNIRQDEAFWPSLAVYSTYLHSAYCWPSLVGSGKIILETIRVLTFWSWGDWQTEPDHGEDGYFWVCKGFPMEDELNSSAWQGQGYDVWSDQGCIAVHGLQSWLGLHTISRTPWQRMAMERMWFCGYIGHLSNASSNRLALLHNPTFCHSYQLWHLTLTHINFGI